MVADRSKTSRCRVRSTGVDGASTPVTVEGAITGLAGALTVVLTAAAFWLSYEHLQEVAARHGMGDAAVRSWAWPATVDLFIVIGELLILRASLARRVDGWAVALASIGSGGSIALNVAGVGAQAQPMDYVVAAVPPVAALLAFGALMRQVHAYLARRVVTPVEHPSTPTTATVDRPQVVDTAPEPVESAPVPELPPSAPAVEAGSTAVDLCSPVVYANRVDGLVRALFGTLGAHPTTSQMTAAMAAAGLGASESTARTARGRVKNREPYLASFPASIAS
ncbi:DUF2637 domain-containing protein [Streptantibioticus rubrisoli]|uniref:DUF2637 domain-containing protein n=1 Tax=Streptantibioticus rubrisoli TaxID=1387313 RepID=A0ABT1PH04_9ACTN|nr:DUF2637 domain-containing protein [Streptantibioticus rubrisoli]MCQ4044651.1 DUF2637 domain-containing protein [Streptantibioticus rubrisoli]